MSILETENKTQHSKIHDSSESFNSSLQTSFKISTRMRSFAAALAFGLPAALACNGENSMPQATETISNSEPIYISSGEVFDGGFARYDRGSGYCQGQSEGGK